MTSHRQLGGKLLLRYVYNAFTNHRGIFLKSNNIQCLGNASMDSKHVWPRLNCSCTIWIIYNSCQSNLSKRGRSHNSLYNQWTTGPLNKEQLKVKVLSPLRFKQGRLFVELYLDHSFLYYLYRERDRCGIYCRSIVNTFNFLFFLRKQSWT